MNHIARVLVPLLLCALTPRGTLAGSDSCPADSVRVGTVCVDRYEASVWRIDPHRSSLIKRVMSGKATRDDLVAGGAVLLGCELVPDPTAGHPSTFPNDGQWTPLPGSDPPSPGVYAASVAGVRPTTCTSWFRAAQACRLSGKRLLRNDEWQDAAAGTPDPGEADDGATTCNTKSIDLSATGSRPACRSSWGAFDMVGNAAEWVADWMPAAEECSLTWLAGDTACLGGGAGGIPAALKRGGTSLSGARAGVFAVTGDYAPDFTDFSSGFRCAR